MQPMQESCKSSLQRDFRRCNQLYRMCTDCPVLQAKLHGEAPKQIKKQARFAAAAAVHHLNPSKWEGPLDASNVMSFLTTSLSGNSLLQELFLPFFKKNSLLKDLRLSTSENLLAKLLDITLSSRLASLNVALNEALKRENYEQAAMLRDQIKTLTDKQK